MEIDYRILTAKDIPSYRQVRLECLKNYPENFGSTHEEESAENSLLFDKLLAKHQALDFFMGAFSGAKLIGICGFRQEGRAKTNHRGEIVQMYVANSFAGKGIAKQLLQLTLERAFSNSSIDQVTLGVVADNKAAVMLYQKLAFAEYGRLENSFKSRSQGATQLFMVLTRANFKKK